MQNLNLRILKFSLERKEGEKEIKETEFTRERIFVSVITQRFSQWCHWGRSCSFPSGLDFEAGSDRVSETGLKLSVILWLHPPELLV